jgi:hypothetical protein
LAEVYPEQVLEKTMPRYYFNVRDHGAIVEDTEGEELADEGVVRQLALLNARDILRVHPISVRDWLGLSYEILDEAGQHVVSVPFSEAVDIKDL